MSKLALPSDDKNLNTDFCRVLVDLAEYEKNVNRNVHKYNAYKNAAAVLASHNKRIESGEEAKKLKGIGEKISKKLDEFLQTGKLKKLENINHDENVTAINLLTRVSGIGPVKAAELVRSGIKTIQDLENNKNTLNHHQLIGLNTESGNLLGRWQARHVGLKTYLAGEMWVCNTPLLTSSGIYLCKDASLFIFVYEYNLIMQYFEDFQKRIPRAGINDIEVILKRLVYKISDKFSVTICGSYRRCNNDSGDIDALITHPKVTLKQKKSKHEKYTLEKMVDTLEGLVIDTISVGETKFMGVVQLRPDLPARRLDIRLIPLEQFYCAVLYFTGSDVFNKRMRAHALEKGFILNEYSLRHIGVTGVPGEPVPISSEEEIFLYLDYPYKQPNERNY